MTAVGSAPGDRNNPASTSRLSGRRRRNVPYLLLGLVLVLGCTAGFVVVTVTGGDRMPVLMLARPVVVGQGLTPSDLREVAVVVDPGLPTVPASEAQAVVGQRMATSLPAGSLLSPGVLGRGSIPGVGRAVAALALSAGQVPAEVFAGAHVLVVFIPDAAAPARRASGSAATWTATVVSVSGQSAEGTGSAGERTLVVSVELAETAARDVAAVPAGQLALVLLSGGDR